MYPEFFDIRTGFFFHANQKRLNWRTSQVFWNKNKILREKKRECRQINTYTKLIFAYSSIYFFYFDWLFVYNSFISKVLVNKNVVSCYIVGYVMISFLPFFSLFFLVRNRCASNAYICKFSLLFLVKVEFISFFNWWKRENIFILKPVKLHSIVQHLHLILKDLNHKYRKQFWIVKKIELSRHFNSSIQNIFSHKLCILYKPK